MFPSSLYENKFSIHEYKLLVVFSSDYTKTSHLFIHDMQEVEIGAATVYIDKQHSRWNSWTSRVISCVAQNTTNVTVGTKQVPWQSKCKYNDYCTVVSFAIPFMKHKLSKKDLFLFYSVLAFPPTTVHYFCPPVLTNSLNSELWWQYSNPITSCPFLWSQSAWFPFVKCHPGTTSSSPYLLLHDAQRSSDHSPIHHLEYRRSYPFPFLCLW